MRLAIKFVLSGPEGFVLRTLPEPEVNPEKKSIK